MHNFSFIAIVRRKNKYEKSVNIQILTICVLPFFNLNALTLTSPYCMLTKGIIDRVFKRLFMTVFPRQINEKS